MMLMKCRLIVNVLNADLGLGIERLNLESKPTVERNRFPTLSQYVYECHVFL